MLVKGKITILIDDQPEGANRIQYGFVKVKGMKEDVFFNTLTSFENTAFEELKIGDKVKVFVKQTDLGPLAESLTISNPRLQKETYSPPPSPSL